jgi:hypothetical protein
MAEVSPGNTVHDPYDRALPAWVVIWSVNVSGKDLNYGQIHEMIHRDIAVGNDYRKERIKLLTTLATGVFALTVTFHKDLFGAPLSRTGLWLMLLGWLALIVSLLAGILHFHKWEDFYLEYRAQGNALWRYRTASDDVGRKEGQRAFNRSGHKINALQGSYKKWNFIQSGGLIIGLVLIATYVVITGFAVSSEKPKISGVPAVGEQATPARVK